MKLYIIPLLLLFFHRYSTAQNVTASLHEVHWGREMSHATGTNYTLEIHMADKEFQSADSIHICSPLGRSVVSGKFLYSVKNTDSTIIYTAIFTIRYDTDAEDDFQIRIPRFQPGCKDWEIFIQKADTKIPVEIVSRTSEILSYP